ncbi:MAG: hypothetical protein H6993_02495 [Pseudomonadales bacterium]|nr:hypothetical protein [Pseudomonadales bacterium]MCP5182798.1 hypothetical protein [Pseudomonadales bacterium]
MTVVLLRGRSRRRWFALLCAVLAAGAWLWFGACGAALLLLWGEANAPRWSRYRLHIPLAQVCEIRLYPRSLAVRRYDGTVDWVFADELPAAEFAALRRGVREQLAGLL